MATVEWRWDYAEFIVVCPRGTFGQYYDHLSRAAMGRKWGNASWDASHKVQALHNFTPDWDRTKVSIWGECTGVVDLLDYAVWSSWVGRLDVRATQWDVDGEAVLHTGQRLQRTISTRNIEVFSSKNASKRLGRDRGGKGFRIGSRKSDFCIVCYKRAQEPAATEYRIKGQALLNALHRIEDGWDVYSKLNNVWSYLKEDIVAQGEKRFGSVMKEAGIGEFWGLWSKRGLDDYEALQSSFLLETKLMDKEEHDEEHWSDQDGEDRHTFTGDDGGPF